MVFKIDLSKLNRKDAESSLKDLMKMYKEEIDIKGDLLLPNNSTGDDITFDYNIFDSIDKNNNK